MKAKSKVKKKVKSMDYPKKMGVHKDEAQDKVLVKKMMKGKC